MASPFERALRNLALASGAVLLGLGSWIGLTRAPAERCMGEGQRIMYVHVPAAWAALLAVTVTFVASLVYLFKGSFKADAVAEASAEVGVFFGALLIVLGSIWARPTWGVQSSRSRASSMFAASGFELSMKRPKKKAASLKLPSCRWHWPTLNRKTGSGNRR